MDWLLFGLAVAAMAGIGLAIGLVVAPRLTGWSDRAAGERDGPEGDELGTATDGEDGPVNGQDGNGGERGD